MDQLGTDLAKATRAIGYSLRIKDAFQEILNALRDEYGLELDQHFADTPTRVAKAYHEMLGGLLDTEAKIQAILSRVFDSNIDEMVVMKDLHVFSVCPHHFANVSYIVSLAYIPAGKVLGVSKLARLVDLLAKRPMIQEDLTKQIAETIQNALACKGIGIRMTGVHDCMRVRGAKKEAPIITQAMLGAFRDNPATRHEFLAAIQ
jgi:GTP cyclohydrolase IA